jgi:S-adenosylmethionine hydrolase
MPATCSPPPQHHLAMGVPLDELGEGLEPETLVQLRIPNPTVEQGRIECEVLDLNRFGNVQLNVRDRHVAAAGLDRLERVSVEAHSGSGLAQFVSTYADLEPGEMGVDG